MSEKRRDNKGRILKTGESQRSDLSYQYRYVDLSGKRVSVYASTLNDLRAKEKEIQAKLEKGLSTTKGSMPLVQLVEEYLSLKQNLRETSKSTYGIMFRRLQSDPFGQTPIGNIKPLDVRKWLISLHNKGYAYNTLVYYKGLMKSSYAMAIENDYVLKNPFAIKMDFIPNNTKSRDALTESEQARFFDYLAGSRHAKYIDMCTILIETGIRVGEFCGLTIGDVDLENKTLNITHQVTRVGSVIKTDSPTKTASGKRTIPLTPKAFDAFKNAIDHRLSKIEDPSLDTKKILVFETRYGNSYRTDTMDMLFGSIRRGYEKENLDLPKITPHILRHTFCTNMINLGMPPKHVQYLMGHHDVNITMNIYTSADVSQVSKSMRILSLID